MSPTHHSVSDRGLALSAHRPAWALNGKLRHCWFIDREDDHIGDGHLPSRRLGSYWTRHRRARRCSPATAATPSIGLLLHGSADTPQARLSPSTAAEDEGLTPSIFSRARAAVALIPSKKYLVRRWGSSDRKFLMRTLRTA